MGGIAQAQDKGGIQGTVTDQTGAVIPGVTVNITNGTITQTPTTDEKGEYQVTDLPPGTYKVSITLQGFKDFKADAVVVAGQTAKVDASLVPVSVVQQVNVEGTNVGQVETETSQLGNTLTTTEITTYQLNGRNFTQLIALAPGVTNTTYQDEALVGVKGSVNYSVNGGRTEYNSFDVDGGDIINASLNKSSSTLIVYPSVDAIGELQVLTSNYGAEYGRSASGTILATTKSGGSQFHGDGYFFVRNEAFNARNFFDETRRAPLYRKYNPGGTIGGPLYIPGVFNTTKDKTFFFFSEEYRHDQEPQTFNQAVPSLQERDCHFGPNPAWCANPSTPGLYADFSDVCPPTVNNLAGNVVPGSIATFSKIPGQSNYYPDCPGQPGAGIGAFTTYPGNYVPYGVPNANGGSTWYGSTAASRNPVSYVLLNQGFIPAPNATAGCNSTIHSCYDASVSPLTTYREELFRIDHNFSSKEKFFVHFIHDAYNTVTPTPLWAFVENSFPTIQNNLTGPGLSVNAHLTSTITNKFVNDVSMAFATDHITIDAIPGPGVTSVNRPGSTSDSPGCTVPCAVGNIFGPENIPGFYFGLKSPGVIIAGSEAAYGSHGFGVDTGFTPWKHSNPTYSPRDDATYVLRNHTFQFGALFILAQRNEINPPVGANIGDVQGLATFTNLQNASSTGNSWADFVAGLPRSFQQDSAQFKYYQRYNIIEPYLKDDWKITKRLTLNLGLRVSLFGLYSEKYNHAYNWLLSEYSSALASQIQVATPQSFSNIGAPAGSLVYTGTNIPVPLNPLNLDPHIVNGLVQCGVSTVHSGIHVPSGCMFGHLVNPAPRIGFAWDPFGNGKTSIRAGYGIFYEHGTGNEANTGSLEGSPANYGQAGVIDMTQLFPPNWASIGSSGGAYPINLTSIPTRVQWPYVQQWNLSVQRELPGDMVATAAYVGSKGTHLTAELQINQLKPVSSSENPYLPGQPVLPSNCTNLSVFVINNTTITPSNPIYGNVVASCIQSLPSSVPVVPLALLNSQNSLAPGLGQIYSLQNIANSGYNAFQFTMRRAKGPLTLGLSYTYSHSLDDSSDRTTLTFINAYDVQSSHANSDFDQRHNLTVSYIYKLPILPIWQGFTHWSDQDSTNTLSAGSNGDASELKKRLFDGWELSGITVYQTGLPFSVLNAGTPGGISSGDNAGVLAVNGIGSYPDVVRNPTPLAPGSGQTSSTFGPLLGNPNEFVAPTGLTYGNAGRNFLNNPSRINFDMALLKNTKLSERWNMQLRLEAFNIFNHTQFRITDPTNFGNTGNNVISCYGGPNYSAGNPSCLVSSSFLHPVDAHRPRTIQLGLKFLF